MVHKYFVLYSCKNSLFDAGIDEYSISLLKKYFPKRNLIICLHDVSLKHIKMLMDCTVRDVCLWLCMKCSQFTEIKKWYKNISTYIQMANKYKKSPWKILFCKHFRSTVWSPENYWWNTPLSKKPLKGHL